MPIENKENKFYAFTFMQLFLAYSLLYTLLTFVGNEYIYTSKFYYSIFQGTLDTDRIADTIHTRQKFQWMSYLLQPVLLLLRCYVFAAVLFTSLFLFKTKLSFRNCLKIVIVADIVALIVTFIRTIYFLWRPASTFSDFQSFYPLSLMQVLDVKSIPKYFRYPLQQINVFEVCYWVLLALGVKSFTDCKWRQSFSVVASSYGVTMLLWIMTVVFVTLQFS